MATIALSALGMAVGGSMGGSVLGLSMAAIGRAVGASVGQAIDQRLLGSGAQPVETGRLDRLRLTGASEGAAIARVYGQVRVPGQVIWASRFQEHSQTTSGGKSGPDVTQFSYSVNLAIALCEGEISGIGRIWADGREIAPSSLSLRLYRGTQTQRPDPRMEAIEGANQVPSYRGIAYVVIEDLALGQFGNRVPQFNFEVTRPSGSNAQPDIADLVQGVALVPGTGEYALSTNKVTLKKGFGDYLSINENSASGETDLVTSLDAMEVALPKAKSVSLVVSWFGDDLRCGSCSLKPKVEQIEDGDAEVLWSVSSLARSNAELVPYDQGRPIYGGTPSDASVVEALRDLSSRGLSAVFYPFILMDQMAGNGLPDPWTGGAGQAHLPWRGRITTSLAPAQAGSPDGSAVAASEVANFFGSAQASDFVVQDGAVIYTGPDEWSYRRFILHYAHLCAGFGGVDAFCIGSEMRSLTQIRGENGSFPAVDAMRVLAADVRSILGAQVKIGYAADWSEYHGYQPAGTADKLFHLDPLWADPAIDFIGIDNYMPLSDWRDGNAHLDAGSGSIYNLDYLAGNIAGGEGFDWYYHSPEARAAQIRTPITDGEGEPWVWRYKDLVSWWGNAHHNRVGGVREPAPTAWVPQSKPIWFTELGCAAVDKSTNEPNKFVDPKSSETSLPYASNGQRDDIIQMQYLRAVFAHFAAPSANPHSSIYNGPMVDMTRAHVWSWDARPFPYFPANTGLWSDGENYHLGHWLNGRAGARSLASVVSEVCEHAGVTPIDVSKLYGVVRGYTVDRTSSPRSVLQPLMLVHGFDAVEREGVLHFVTRGYAEPEELSPEWMVEGTDGGSPIEQTRRRDAEVSGRVRIGYIDGSGDYAVRTSEATLADEIGPAISESEFPMVMTHIEARKTAERWLAEARRARGAITFALPPSRLDIGAGDIVSIKDRDYRVDRVDVTEHRVLEATEIAHSDFVAAQIEPDPVRLPSPAASLPIDAFVLDLPMIGGTSGPHFAASAANWPGDVALYSSATTSGFKLWHSARRRAVMGQLQTGLPVGRADIWDRSEGLTVKLISGGLSSAEEPAVLGGDNIAAIGDGSPDGWEIIQFCSAELIAPRSYRLSKLLRGRFGTQPRVLGAQSYFVLLNSAVEALEWSGAQRDVLQHLWYGPANKPLGDSAYRGGSVTLRNTSLRPYPVSHLRADFSASGLAVSWVRQTRIDGENWSGAEVPLGEENESYQVKVFDAGSLVQSETVGQNQYVYDAQSQVADGTQGHHVTVQVMQLSARFGPGVPREISVQL